MLLTWKGVLGTEACGELAATVLGGDDRAAQAFLGAMRVSLSVVAAGGQGATSSVLKHASRARTWRACTLRPPRGHVPHMVGLSSEPSVRAQNLLSGPWEACSWCGFCSKALLQSSLCSEYGLKCPLTKYTQFLACWRTPPLTSDLLVVLGGGMGLQAGKAAPGSLQRGRPRFPQRLSNCEMWL